MIPIPSRISSSSCPARPTNGSPWRSSSAPGRLADEHQVRVGVAGAEHRLVRPSCSGQRVHSPDLPVERDQPPRASRSAAALTAPPPPSRARLRRAVKSALVRSRSCLLRSPGRDRPSPPASSPARTAAPWAESTRSAAAAPAERHTGRPRCPDRRPTHSKRSPHSPAAELVDRHVPIVSVATIRLALRPRTSGRGRAGIDRHKPETDSDAVWYLRMRELEREDPTPSRDRAARRPSGGRRGGRGACRGLDRRRRRARRARGDTRRARSARLDRRRPEAVLLCVPDQAITEVAAELVARGAAPRFAGHASGASTLDVLAPLVAAGAVPSPHPLQTVPDRSTDFTGCPAAIAGSTPPALEFARTLTERLGGCGRSRSPTSTARPTTRPPAWPPTSSSRLRTSCARLSRPTAAPRPLDRPCADHGRPARRPSRAAARGPRAVRRGGPVALRQPDPVRPRRGPRRATRATRSATPARRRGRRRLGLRAHGRRAVPAGLRDRGRGRAA